MRLSQRRKPIPSEQQRVFLHEGTQTLIGNRVKSSAQQSMLSFDAPQLHAPPEAGYWGPLHLDRNQHPIKTGLSRAIRSG